MMAGRLSWSHRLQARLRREATFLPKRLVVVALLLFALYLGLFFRTEYNTLYTRLGFVEASLKSKLWADYEGVERPAIPFTPLRLEIIKAKIQDENPYLSDKEVAVLVQASIDAAGAPILQATATPSFNGPATINAAVVIKTDLKLGTQAQSNAPKPRTSITPGLGTSSIMVALGAGNNFAFQLPHYVLEQLSGNESLRMPLAPLTTGQTVAGLPPTDALPMPSSAVAVALNPVPPLQVTAVSPPPAIQPQFAVVPAQPTNGLPVIGVSVEPLATVTHLAASQPSQSDTPTVTPTPTVLTAVLLVTAIPSATSTPWPTATPQSTWTLTPAPTVPTPTVTRNPTVAGVQLSATATALVLPVATATTPPVLTAGPTATTTVTPPPPTAPPTSIATQPATPTLPPVVTPTATTAIPPTLTPTTTALPLVDHLTAYVQGDKIYLEWPTATSAGIVGYNLYRQDIHGSDERLNTAPIQSPSYIDTVALDGRRYLYRVTIVDQLAQESLPSQAVTVTVEDRLPPQIPANLVVQLTGEQVQIVWAANTESDLIGYNIYRDTQLPIGRDQGPLNGAALVVQPIYADTIIGNGQTYYYSLTAVDAAGNESALSSEVQITTKNGLAPAPPTGLTAIFEDDDDDDDDEDNEDEINLKWQANQETDVIGYRLYRSTTLPVDTTVAPLHKKPLLTTLRYKDEDLARDTTYYYVVVAVDQDQQVSPPSAPVAVVVPK